MYISMHFCRADARIVKSIVSNIIRNLVFARYCFLNREVSRAVYFIFSAKEIEYVCCSLTVALNTTYADVIKLAPKIH